MRVDNSYLLGLWGNGFAGTATSAVDIAAAARRNASADPTPPWGVGSTAPKRPELLQAAMAGRRLIDESAAKLDIKGASADYKKLFATHQGLSSLQALVDRADAKDVTATELRQIQRRFEAGLKEVADYIDGLDLETMRIVRGQVEASQKASVGMARPTPDYVGPAIHEGSVLSPAAVFEGDVRFSLTAQRTVTTGGMTSNIGDPVTVNFDLAEMGDTPRTFGAVVKYMNDKLAAAKVQTKFELERIPGAPREMEIGGKKVTLSPGVDSYALKVAGFTGERVSFDAPAKADAVYVVQRVNEDTKDTKEAHELLKFQTDVAAGAAPPGAKGRVGETFPQPDRAFQTSMSSAIANARAMTTAPDGSVYVLADVDATVGDQTIKGDKDVALMKYDSAGQLLYTRTLGAADTASGYAITVSADGKVAVAGSVKGGLADAATFTADRVEYGQDATKADSFVTVFDAEGDELWTQRRGARDEDEALSVAFGADGSVYVTGRTRSAMQGATASGGWDGYVQAFAPPSVGMPNGTPGFTLQTGTSGDDRSASVVVDGANMYVASLENGAAVVRRYALNGTSTPTLQATQNLGQVGSAGIAGMAVQNGRLIIAGTTSNADLGAGATVTRGYSGGSDAFVMTVDASLSGAGKTVNYYGGSGDDVVTSVKVMDDGSVYLGGQAGLELPGQGAVGKKDGFLARLDAATGEVEWSKRFTGQGSIAAPTAIAVAKGGASVLDRLGLPQGAIDQTPSAKIVSGTSLRAGDKFYVQSGESGRPAAVTITADDTLETLARKIERATGYRAEVTIKKDVVREADKDEDDSKTLYGLQQRLVIEPKDSRAQISIIAGDADQDALASLGLKEGLLREKVDAKKSEYKAGVFGLDLSRDLKLDDKESIKAAMTSVTAALTSVRDAYTALAKLNDPKTAAAGASGGKVPAYLQAQMANYQAGLNRLLGYA